MDNKTNADAMYDFLIIPENFTAAIDLSENLVRVEARLRDEFWIEVTEALRSKLKGTDLVPNIEFTSKSDDSNCQWFELKKSDWFFYYISTDGEDIGIRIHESKRAELQSKEELVKSIIENNNPATGIFFRNIGWPCWKTFGNYRFQKKDEKVHILPSVRDAKIQECSNILYDYVAQIIPLCETLNYELSKQYVLDNSHEILPIPA